MVDDDQETSGTVMRVPAGAPTAGGAGLEPGAAFDPTAPGVAHVPAPGETIVPMWSTVGAASLPEPGYQIGETIGRGGMGEIVAAHDQRIGREVAIKRIRGAHLSQEAIARFLREARIQARLDHPAIVPVYELGTDAAGQPFFTMKRLAGETLAKRIGEQAPIQRLLRAFVDVCNAIELAHARGVVHRDLKPANIMLGDYGEVYVIDWGIARVLTDRTRTTAPQQAVADADAGLTSNEVLGTPGYMSPEQARGHEITTKTDIYSLGAILFEILTGQALHPRGADKALASTLSRPREAPVARAPDRQIAPELDAACYDALAGEPDARPTAKALGHRVQAYLDGDRDLERRRTLAAVELAGARAALEQGGPDGRAAAVRRAGRALALDPDSTDAAELVGALILEPPDEHPPALVDALAEDERAFNRVRARQGFFAYLSLFAMTPFLLFLDVKSWPAVGLFYGLVAVGAMLAYRTSRTGAPHTVFTFGITMLVALVFARIASPFVLTPVVLAGIIMQLSSIKAFMMRLPLFLGWLATVVMLPFILEWTGLIAPSYTLNDGSLAIHSMMFGMKGNADQALLVVVNLVFVLTAALVALMLNRRRTEARERVAILAWHLKQLVPGSDRKWHTNPRSKRSIALDSTARG